MKKQSLTTLLIAGAAVLVIVLVLVFSGSSEQKQTTFLEKYQLAGLSIEEIVHRLDSTTSEDPILRTSITSEELILTDGSQEVRLPLPEGKFYLSFAPYLGQTHPCATHSLTTCRGELVGKTIHATILTDEGEEVLNGDFMTMENGFTGVWLPADISATIEVSYEGLTASAPIGTFAGSDTCLTNPLQLN